jgi:rhodanese-related sulfurtransferase
VTDAPGIVTRLLALVGLAAILGGVHSLIVPIHLKRQGGGSVPLHLLQPREGGETPPRAPSQATDAPEITPAETPPASPPTPGEPLAVADDKIPLATGALLHERFMAGEAVLFLDARVKRDFDAGRITGALHMPHNRISSGDGLDELSMYASPGDETVLVIYCTGGDCEASEDTAILLEAAGYLNIIIMAAGYDDWAQAGLPVESGGGTP